MGAAPLRAQSPLDFGGFPAGASLDLVQQRLRELDAAPLGCTRARRDSTVAECRGRFTDPETGRTVEVWLSAIHDSAAVLTLETGMPLGQLQELRNQLARRYGTVPVRVQGSQRMLQWVRSGRMLRLTWRIDQNPPVVSASLVDGGILDRWGQRRNAGTATAPGP